MQVTNRHEEDPGTLSASQIDVWKECRRKWAFIYIEGLRPVTGVSAALGSKTHKQLETWLQGGRLDFTEPGGDIAAIGLHHLPAPGSVPLEIERAFKFRSADTGLYYRGFVDLAIAPEHRPTYVPLIHDHKTTSSISAWAKSPEVLRTDNQAMIYAKSALLRWPKAQAVDLQWLYLQTRGPKVSKLVQLQVSRAHVEEVFPKIEVDAKLIIATLTKKTRALDLPPTVSACSNYGGCPYRNNCNLSPEQHLAATMSAAMEKTSMSDTPINFLAGFLTPAPLPSVPGDIVTPVLTDRDVPPGDAAKSPFFQNLPPAVSPFPPSDQPINPPEFQPPPPSGQAAIDAAVAALPAQGEEKTKGKGRPKGSKNKPSAEERTETLPNVDTAPTIPAPAMVEESVPQQVATLELRVPFTLYVDCIPVGSGSYVHLETYIAQANEDIKKSTGALEWRLGEAVAFGKGPGMLSARVAEIAKERNKNVVLDTRTPEGGVCKAALMALTSNIVMGFR